MLFVLCVLAGGVGWIYGVCESRWIRRGHPRAFRYGLPILHLGDSPILLESMRKLSKPINTESGIIVPLPNQRFGFAPRYGLSLSPLAAIQTILMFTGIISRESDRTAVLIRVPLGITACIATWVVGWVVFAIFLGPTAECHINDKPYPPGSTECSLLGVIPPALVSVFAGLAIVAIRARARTLFGEIRAHILRSVMPTR